MPLEDPGCEARVGYPAVCVEAQAGGEVSKDCEVSACTPMASPHYSLASTVTQVSVLSRRMCDSLFHIHVPQSQDPPDH